MRNQGPMWNVDPLADEVDRLLAAAGEVDVAVADDARVRLQRVLNDTIAGLIERLRRDFRSNQTRRTGAPTLGADVRPTVQRTSGRAEHGADFVVFETDRFDHVRTTVVQLKDYESELSGNRPLEQIREAASWYAPVSAAVILTTAEHEADDFAKARDGLSEELAIPVTVVLGEQLARWFLAHLEAVAAD
jgi:Restriction endonuclease